MTTTAISYENKYMYVRNEFCVVMEAVLKLKMEKYFVMSSTIPLKLTRKCHYWNVTIKPKQNKIPRDNNAEVVWFLSTSVTNFSILVTNYIDIFIQGWLIRVNRWLKIALSIRNFISLGGYFWCYIDVSTRQPKKHIRDIKLKSVVS